MRILIVEEQLCDANSHHLQYLRTIRSAAMERKIEVTIAANADFSSEHESLLSAKPVLQDLSRFAARRSRLSKYTTLIRNIWANASAVRQLINNEGPFDRVLCLTSWWPQLASLLVAKWRLAGKLPPLGLLLVNYPRLGERTSAQFRLVRRLVRMLCNDVRIFAETKYAQKAWSELLGCPVDYVVHPVATVANELPDAAVLDTRLPTTRATQLSTIISPMRSVVLGFYGFARHEQGVDVLMRALEILQRRGELTAEFRVLWPQGFPMPDGVWMDRHMFEHLRPNVRFIECSLSPTEYIQALAETDWLILPYRSDSYEGRCSRVSIEACVMGIPVIYTKGTDLETVLATNGAGIGVVEEDPEALADGILEALIHNDLYQRAAKDQRMSAIEYFSGYQFLDRVCPTVRE